MMRGEGGVPRYEGARGAGGRRRIVELIVSSNFEIFQNYKEAEQWRVQDMCTKPKKKHSWGS